MCWKKFDKTDPVKHCIVYKEFGCAHVDGMLCDFETCSIRNEQELWNMEEEMGVPYNLRYYKSVNSSAKSGSKTLTNEEV